MKKGDKELEGEEDEEGVGFMRQEAVRLPENCPGCSAPGESLTCIADIPHFKEVMIMAFECDDCGFKSSEVSLWTVGDFFKQTSCNGETVASCLLMEYAC